MPYVDLNISTRHQDNHVVVAAAGEIDLHTAPQLERELGNHLDGDATHLIVDLSSVEFCDSTGMNVLLSALRRAQEQGGTVSLAGPQPPVRKVLGITGLDSVFQVRESVEEVVSAPPQS